MIPYTTKALLTLLIGILVAQSLCGQQVYQLDSVVNTWSHYETYTQVSSQQYDSIHRILVTESEVRDGSGGRDEGTRKTQKHDEQGNELLFIDSHWNKEKNQWADRTRSERAYDEMDRILSCTEYELQRDQWVPIVKHTYEYEDKSVTYTKYRYIGKQWMPIEKKNSLFNVHGQEILVVEYQWDRASENWVNWLQHENIFLRDTLLQECVTYTWKDGEWTNTEKTVYNYIPETEQLSDRVVYIGTGDEWQFKHLTQLKYFQAVRREEVFNWSEDNKDWLAETFKEAYTDRFGRDTDVVFFTWNIDSSEYRKHLQSMTVYDEQDRVTQTQEIRYENGRISSGMEVLYHFDQDGNMYKEVHRSLIGRRWEVQATTEFSFDKTTLLRDATGRGNVFDQSAIGHEYSSKNKHAISGIRNYRQMDGEMILQEEWKYYYSK